MRDRDGIILLQGANLFCAGAWRNGLLIMAESEEKLQKKRSKVCVMRLAVTGIEYSYLGYEQVPQRFHSFYMIDLEIYKR